MTEAAGVPIRRPAFLDDAAVAAVLAALPGARAVGGCVRDALAARASADVDVAAPLRARGDRAPACAPRG